MARLQLNNERYVYIDDDLEPALAGKAWRLSSSGKSVYRNQWVDGRAVTVTLTEAVTGEKAPKGEVWGRKDGDWRNFRRDNLILVKRGQHLLEDADKLREWQQKAAAASVRRADEKPRGATGYRGVHKYLGKFRAVATVDGKQKFLGVRKTPEEAAVLYDLEMVRQGKSAINFPEEVPAL